MEAIYLERCIFWEENAHNFPCLWPLFDHSWEKVSARKRENRSDPSMGVELWSGLGSTQSSLTGTIWRACLAKRLSLTWALQRLWVTASIASPALEENPLRVSKVFSPQELWARSMLPTRQDARPALLGSAEALKYNSLVLKTSTC